MVDRVSSLEARTQATEREFKRAADAFTVQILRATEGRDANGQIEVLALVIGTLHAQLQAQIENTRRLTALIEAR